MSSLKQLLLKEAKRRFEIQKNESNNADASYMAPISPSPPGLIEEALGRLNSQGTSTGLMLIRNRVKIVDLGCGDGRWLLEAAKHFRTFNVRCVGYDLDQELLAKAESSKANLVREFQELSIENNTSVIIDDKSVTAAEEEGGEVSNSKVSIQFYEQDLMLADVANATIVIAYLFREGCIKVQEKLEKEMILDDCAVLSVGFELRGWEPSWTIRVNGSVPLYFYTKPWREKKVSSTSDMNH